MIAEANDRRLVLFAAMMMATPVVAPLRPRAALRRLMASAMLVPLPRLTMLARLAMLTGFARFAMLTNVTRLMLRFGSIALARKAAASCAAAMAALAAST